MRPSLLTPSDIDKHLADGHWSHDTMVSRYRAFAQFLKWRKQQSAMMDANLLSDLVRDGQEIAFKRVSGTQTLQCRFNFETLTATFEEL